MTFWNWLMIIVPTLMSVIGYFALQQ